MAKISKLKNWNGWTVAENLSTVATPSVAALFLMLDLASADNLSAASDLDLIKQTRDAFAEQDATRALDLLTEMRRRGTGAFTDAEGAICKDVIALSKTITN